jgi:mRNA interferase YafQ
MTAKKSASSKRAPIPRRSDYTKTFAKDWERMSRSGRYDMHLLKQVMGLLIANDAPLPPEWLDHELNGSWSDHRECHVGGDFFIDIPMRYQNGRFYTNRNACRFIRGLN